MQAYKPMEPVQVDIVDGNKIVDSYWIAKLNIGANARRLTMINAILETDLSDGEKGQLMNCAALAATLQDEKGNLLYPADDDYKVIYDSMDAEVFILLVGEYLEINPLQSKLKAKKKKS